MKWKGSEVCYSKLQNLLSNNIVHVPPAIRSNSHSSMMSHCGGKTGTSFSKFMWFCIVNLTWTGPLNQWKVRVINNFLPSSIKNHCSHGRIYSTRFHTSTSNFGGILEFAYIQGLVYTRYYSPRLTNHYTRASQK